jgi:hypothetical protein
MNEMFSFMYDSWGYLLFTSWIIVLEVVGGLWFFTYWNLLRCLWFVVRHIVVKIL